MRLALFTQIDASQTGSNPLVLAAAALLLVSGRRSRPHPDHARSRSGFSVEFPGGNPMPQKVRGVVAHKKGEKVSVETILVPDPGPGEAVVQVQACGVCHTDLH
jgi:hypothetical protein